MNQHASSGVWGRSTPAAFETYIIFCVGQDAVKIAAFKSWAISRIGFKPLVGCYKGQMEQSFITNVRNLPLIREWLNGEESILYIEPNRRAILRYHDGREEALGHLISCQREYALSRQSWTYDPSTDDYYVAI